MRLEDERDPWPGVRTLSDVRDLFAPDRLARLDKNDENRVKLAVGTYYLCTRFSIFCLPDTKPDRKSDRINSRDFDKHAAITRYAQARLTGQ